jgi:hypothetical protein
VSKALPTSANDDAEIAHHHNRKKQTAQVIVVTWAENRDRRCRGGVLEKFTRCRS